MSRPSLFLILISLSVGCGKAQNSQVANEVVLGKVIGGVDVTAPTIYSKRTVGIYNAKEKTVCTGVIIEENLILTAAHCVYETPVEKVEVIFGNKIFDPNADKIKASRLVVHENYDDENITNDVALVRLSKNIPETYSAIDLEASRQLVLEKGELVTAIGFGVSNTGLLGSITRGTLRTGELPVDEYESGSKLVVIDQSKGVAICFGDSGGPVFTLVNEQPVLVGISSFVNSEKSGRRNICKFKSYLSNPNYFYTWIHKSKLKS